MKTSASTLLIFFVFIYGSFSFHLTITPGQERCFYEDLVPKQTAYFTYQLPTLKEARVEVTFIDPNGRKLEHKVEETLKQGFVFESNEEQGFYEICFTPEWNPMHIEILVNQHQELKSFEKKDRIKRIEIGVENVHAYLSEVSFELEYMKGREEKFRQTSFAIKYRLLALHALLVLVLILTALWQIYSLKNFFKEKKLID